MFCGLRLENITYLRAFVMLLFDFPVTKINQPREIPESLHYTIFVRRVFQSDEKLARILLGEYFSYVSSPLRS